MAGLKHTEKGIEIDADENMFDPNSSQLRIATDPQLGTIRLPDGRFSVAADPFGGLTIGVDGLKIAPVDPAPVTQNFVTPLVNPAFALNISDGDWATVGFVICNVYQTGPAGTPKHGYNWQTVLPKITLAYQGTGTHRLLSFRFVKQGAVSSRWNCELLGVDATFGAPDNTLFVRDFSMFDPVAPDPGTPFQYDGEGPDGMIEVQVKLDNPGTMSVFGSQVIWQFGGND